MSSIPLESEVPLEVLPRRYKDVYDIIECCLLDFEQVIGDIQSHAAKYEAKLMKALQEFISELPGLPRVLCKPFTPWRLNRMTPEQAAAMSRALHKSIKFMVHKNPHALLWHHDPPEFLDYESSVPCYEEAGSAFDNICDNECHASVLLLWLIENYGDVLMGQKFKSAANHRAILRSFCLGFCPTTTVRRFYQLFPQAVKQNVEEDLGVGYENYPIHYAMVEDPEEADFELFGWMVQQHPKTVEVSDSSGQTIFHRLFRNSRNPVQYANILIDECPWIIYKKDKHGELPINKLVRRRCRMYRRSSFNEEDCKVLVRLLRRMYVSKENPINEILPRVPYVERICEHLRRQHQLSLNAVAIKRIQAMMAKALDVDKSDQCLSEVNEVYSDWSKKHLPVIANTIRNISEIEIPKVRLEVQGQSALRRL